MMRIGLTIACLVLLLVACSGDGGTTATVATKSYDQAAFNQFLKAAVAGTLYDYGRPGSPAESTSAEVYEGAAEDICTDLEAGASEASLRAEVTEGELTGDPEVDADVPVFVDALFRAATTFVCPGN